MIPSRLALLLAIALIAAPPLAGEGTARATGPRAVPVAETASSVSYRIEFASPQLREEAIGDRVYPYLSWEGIPALGAAALAGQDVEGEPALPTHVVQVAVPPRGPVSLTYTAEDLGSARQIRFPPMPRREPAPARPGTRLEPSPTYHLTEGAAYTEGDTPPQAQLLSVGVERGVRVATVAIRPVRWDPRTGNATWSAGVSFTLSHDPVERGLPPALRPDAAGDAAAGLRLLNPDAVPRYRAVADSFPDPPPGGVPEVWFDDAPGWAKIHVGANGMHRLDRPALQNAGVPLATLDPRTLRLYAGPLVPHTGPGTAGWDSIATSLNSSIIEVQPGYEHVHEQPGYLTGFPGAFSQVALWVRGEEDGVFDPGDDVLFYGQKPDNFRDRLGLADDALEAYFVNPHTNETVYWLTWGTGLPDAPLRMATVDAAPGGAPLVTQSRARVHEERDSIYDPSLYLGGYRWDRWFWDFIEESGQGKNIALPHAVPGTTLDAHVRLWGSRIPLLSATGEQAFHHVKVDVNNQEVGVYIWGGTQARDAITPQDVFADDIPVSDPSRFEFRVLPVPGSPPERFDQVELAWIDVTYTRTLHLDGRAGELELDSGTAARTVRVAQPPASPLVFDVGDPRRPRRLTGVTVGGGNLDLAFGPEASVLAVTNDASLTAPVRMIADTPPRTTPGGSVRWLRDTGEPLDYVIIAHDDLVDAAELLAEWRREHLYPFTPGRSARVRVVRVSDIMDEFAWGMWDPAALRFFLEYVYRNYGTLADDPLSYALFLGDTTYDPKNYERTGVTDQTPTWLDNRDGIGAIRNGNVQYASDDPLARFDGREQYSGRPDGITEGQVDSITDLYLGRIVARTPAEARRVIEEKIIKAEREPAYGAWRTKAIMVADDICQGLRPDRLGFVHMSQVEGLISTLPAGFDIDKVYLYEYGEECDVNAKPDAKRALLDSWGEGAWLVNYVGHGGAPVWADEHVLDVTDSPALVNRDKLPVMGAFSCSVGKFANPHVTSIGEALLLAESGAVLSAAATHLTGSNSNAAFNRRFVEFLFPDGLITDQPIGVALMNAKRLVQLENRKYVCLGDAASTLPTPALPLDVAGPVQLERGAVPQVRVEVPGNGGRDGTVDLRVLDADLIRTTNSLGETFCEHARRLNITCASGVNNGYRQRGSLIFEGLSPLRADTAQVRFTVPLSLRGGPDAKVRVYAWGSDWDGMATLANLPVTGDGQTPVVPDSVGPVIEFSVAGGAVVSGQQVDVTLTDDSGINLTELFEFRSIVLKVLDERGLEQIRQNLTPRFRYEDGSHTRGSVFFNVPDLPPGEYRFSVSAFDNYNHRTIETADYSLGNASAGGGFSGVAAYPNPFNPDLEPTQVLFTLPGAGEVEVRVYSVAGRLVRKETVSAQSGRNAYAWDGRDALDDRVANGVYLVQLKLVGSDNPGGEKHLERVLVLR